MAYTHTQLHAYTHITHAWTFECIHPYTKTHIHTFCAFHVRLGIRVFAFNLSWLTLRTMLPTCGTQQTSLLLHIVLSLSLPWCALSVWLITILSLFLSSPKDVNVYGAKDCIFLPPQNYRMLLGTLCISVVTLITYRLAMVLLRTIIFGLNAPAL